ncbi:hypothetical protein GTW43_00300 [Streptomyces sp. SID5785]|uniref:hypothetical protein n=1 Tax=Streptomyces sp. SID5785 TaxID=2690309 RepID=UPI00136104A0|nr:hypothetical protein [Streptomyces sp. SID5785]MZD03529.1 hypothetical protein [Streptomyces sp. SID5785]
MPRPRVSALLAAAAGLVLLAGLAGCSPDTGDHRGYAVPGELCDVPVPVSVIEPLLPDGERLTTRSGGTDGLRTCTLTVDGDLAVSAKTERWEHGTSVRKVMSATPGLGDAAAPARAGQAVATSSAGLRRVDCGSAPGDREEVFATVRAENAPGESALRKAVTAYARGAADAAGTCGRG